MLISYIVVLVFNITYYPISIGTNSHHFPRPHISPSRSRFSAYPSTVVGTSCSRSSAARQPTRPKRMEKLKNKTRTPTVTDLSRYVRQILGSEATNTLNRL